MKPTAHVFRIIRFPFLAIDAIFPICSLGAFLVERSRAITNSRSHTGEPSPESNRIPDPDLGPQRE